MKLQKFICYTLLFVGAIMFHSCGKRKSTNTQLLHIESLLPEHPDSASKMLEEFKSSRSMLPVEKAAWNLIYAYSCFLSDKTEENIQCAYKAVEYYNGTGLLREEGLANFLYGHALIESDRIDEGMRSLKKASSVLLNSNEYNLLGLSYYYMGYNYALDAVYDKALHFLRLASMYFEKADETINMAYAYRELANAFDLGRYPTDSALVYFEKSQKLLLSEKDTAGYYDVGFYRAITLLNRTNRFAESKNEILKAYRYYNNDSYYHNKLSYAYSRNGQADSALYYYRLSLTDTTNIYGKMAVYMAGAYAYMAAGDYKNAVEAFLKYDKNKTEVVNNAQKSQLYRIDKGFDMSEKEKENAALRVRQRNMVFQFGLLTIVVLILVLAFMMLNFKRKREQLQHYEEKLILLEGIERKRLVLLAKIQSRIDTVLKLNKMESKFRAGVTDVNMFVVEILSNSVLKDSEWLEYIEEIDMVCNHHISTLATEFPTLTNADKIVIALTSMKIDITDSCTVLGMNKNTMYRRRNTIKERLGLDKTVDFEVWILDRVAKSLAKDEQNTLIKKILG